MSKELPLRNEIPIELTWDLTSIFESDDQWEASFKALSEKIKDAKQFKGKLGESPEALLKAIKFQEDAGYDLGLLYVYAHLKFDTDTTNSTYSGFFSNVQGLYAQFLSAFSFYKTELLSNDEDVIFSYLDQNPDLTMYRHDLRILFDQRPYTLSENEERLLAEASDVLQSPATIFGMLNNADIQFRKVVGDDGEEQTLSHGRYSLFLESKNRDVRKDAFFAMYEAFKGLKNTFATTLSSQVKVHNLNARLRGFKSAREAALFANHIPESVYDALVEAVNQRLDLLHRYVDLRKHTLNLDELAMYDMYTPLVKELDVKFTYEEAKSIILKALNILGDEYLEVLEKAFNERWIDVVENKGKRSGAYSSGTYGTNPYILMNWQDNVDNLFTLAHELGHSVHSYFSRKYQPFVYSDYSIFLAEVASTTNEILLTDFMLKTYDDPKLKAYLINHYLDGFKGTVFRQTQFAEFEHFVHQSAQEQKPLTVDYLVKNYFDLNKKYYGENMVYDEEIGYEWARIPHFYYNYYVYQYATGFSAASALSAKILDNPTEAVEPYLNYLKSGSSDYPIEVLKKAGVDMTSNEATIDALKVFEKRLSELETLLKG